MSGNVSSTGSSPRKYRGNSHELALVAKDKSSSAASPTPLASRPACHSSALHSAWIQRIIPLHSRKQPVTQSYNFYDKKGDGEDQSQDTVRPMDIEEEDNTLELNKSFRSWLTRKSVEEMQSIPLVHSEADLALPMSESPSNTAESQGKPPASLDSKVLPVLEDLPTEQNQKQSSPWFIRIANRDEDHSAAQNHKGKSLKAIRSFPPLKSGEQWPGTLKPTGLPPLRIPAARSPEQSSRQVRAEHLPLLTPVNFPWVADENKTNAQEQKSNTCSLPSNFVSDLYRGSDRTKSLPARLLNGSSIHASLSDTESLPRDFLAPNLQPVVDSTSREVDSGSLRKSRQTQENSFSRLVSSSTGRSNQALYRSSSKSGQSSRQQPQRQIPSSNEQQENDSAYIKTRKEERLAGAEKAAAGSSHLKADHLPVRGSQQWLQRWEVRCADSQIGRA